MEKHAVDKTDAESDPNSRYFTSNGEPVLKNDPDFNPEHYSCNGEYVGAPPPLPKDMKMMALFLDEFMSREVSESVQEVNEKIRLQVEAMPEYQDGKNPSCIRYHGKTPLFAEELSSDETEGISSDEIKYVSESESTFLEISEEILSSEDGSLFSEAMDIEMLEDIGNPSYCRSMHPPEDRLPANAEILNLYNLNAAVVVPKDQRWTDLTDSGFKLAAAGKYISGQSELSGPLSMCFSSGAAAMKEKLKGSQTDFNEGVSDILASMMVENLVQSQAANMVLMSLDTPFNSEYMKLLKTKQQADNQILKLIETKQNLTTIPIRIKHAAQVNLGHVQQVVNNDDRRGE